MWEISSNGYKYFITFIADYSGRIRPWRKIYYGRYDGHNRVLGPFAKVLKREGITHQYTTLGTLEQNGVAERRNHTLLAMVKSVVNLSTQLENLCGEALKAATYIINQYPTKQFKNLFELTCKKPSLRHFHVWGYIVEAKVYNPNEKRLDPRIVRYFFIGNPKRSKGYGLYCPSYHKDC